MPSNSTLYPKRNVTLSVEMSIIGTWKSTPVNLPFTQGRTRPTALDAPVGGGCSARRKNHR